MGEIGGFRRQVNPLVVANRFQPYIRDMKTRILVSSLLGFLCVVLPAAAQPGRSFTTLSYATTVAGLTVMMTEADVEMSGRGYRIDIATRTAGTYGLLFRGETRTLAQGVWSGNTVAPQRYAVSGAWRGSPRQTLMDYVTSQPDVLRLEPPNAAEREPVPPELQRETVDTISAAALLARQATLTSACNGSLRTFDGRRLFEVTSRTGGWETLPPGATPAYAGPALRCEFEGRLLAGFLLDADRESSARPQKGTAWLARLTRDSPMLPVRLSFEIPWLGSASMTLLAAKPEGPPLVRQRADADAAPLRR